MVINLNDVYIIALWDVFKSCLLMALKIFFIVNDVTDTYTEYYYLCILKCSDDCTATIL